MKQIRLVVLKATYCLHFIAVVFFPPLFFLTVIYRDLPGARALMVAFFKGIQVGTSSQRFNICSNTLRGHPTVSANTITCHIFECYAR